MAIFSLIILKTPQRAKAAANSFTKEIKLFSREGIADVAGLNPYAVQNGDELLVTLKVKFNETGNTNNAAITTDEFLKIEPDGSMGRCSYIEGSYSPIGSLNSSEADIVDKIQFKHSINSSNDSAEFAYKCRINLTDGATYNNLPEIMRGQLTIEQSWNVGRRIISRTYYAGMPANEVIANYDANDLLGFRASADFDKCSLYWPIFPSVGSCYNLNKTSSIKNMVSQTKAEDTAVLEIAALLWPDNSIIGDAYSIGNYLNNFAFYGRNLSKSSGTKLGSGYSWGIEKYQFNDQAQSSYSHAQSAYYKNRIKQLASEASIISHPSILESARSWYLQKDGYIGTGNNSSTKYPEGEVWSVSGRTVSLGSVAYRGVGTIIINASKEVVIKEGAEIVPADSQSFLGIIVRGGKLTFEGNNKIQAAVFVEDDSIKSNEGVTVDNITAIGSFAAENFDFGSNARGIRFYYDYRLDSGWPPGFRYFNMPTAKNTAQ